MRRSEIVKLQMLLQRTKQMTKQVLLLAALAAGLSLGTINATVSTDDAETKAIAFLAREVPAWSKTNGCFSCHNNGDAARALYAATRKGLNVPANALADTNAWASNPTGWKNNKGDPGFSDKRLANIQFAASLLAAIETGHVKDRRPLADAARLLIADQGESGAWKIDSGNAPGSPATYGTPLATLLALRTLKAANLPKAKAAIQKAETWMRQTSPNNVLTAAALLLFAVTDGDKAKQTACLKLIQSAQTSDGGWGPYADSPAEVFDTAVVLLALNELRSQPTIETAIRRGRTFLRSEQQPDGSWPETTRPSGGESYAQRMSTTGWATLALLETH